MVRNENKLEELRLVSFEYISPRKIMLPHQQSYVVSKVDDPSVNMYVYIFVRELLLNGSTDWNEIW